MPLLSVDKEWISTFEYIKSPSGQEQIPLNSWRTPQLLVLPTIHRRSPEKCCDMIMERPTSYHARSAALLLALLLCCSLVCSAPVFLDGDRDGQRPPAPIPSHGKKTDCPGCGHTRPPGTSARRKTLQVADNVDPSA